MTRAEAIARIKQQWWADLTEPTDLDEVLDALRDERLTVSIYWSELLNRGLFCLSHKGRHVDLECDRVTYDILSEMDFEEKT